MIDVLVIGAGPTGLMMAAEAARYGMTCRIIDKSPTSTDKSKALAIQPRTLEIFDHLGIVDRFLASGIKIGAANPMSGSKRLAHFSFASLDSPFPFILSLEQSKTEALLTEYLASFGLKVEREVECLDLEQETDKVVLTLLHSKTGQKERVEAAWVVGCDGAHSQVRKELGLSFSGEAFPSTFSLTDVEIEWKYPHDELFAFFNPEGIMAAIPMPGERRYRLVFQHAAPPTLEEAAAMVKKYADANARVRNATWTAQFHIHSRLVKSYQKGRVFLAGDAAHIHSPIGGQGMNSGLQDAFNLAWKLQHSEWLATYTLERRSWGKQLLKSTRLATKFATFSNPFLIAIRNWWIRHIASKWMGGPLIRAIAQLSIRYPKSLLVRESGVFKEGPKAGMRAPNAPLFINGEKTDLYSLMRKTTCHHLLVFGGSILHFELDRALDTIPIRIHPNDLEAQAIYGIKEPSVYLIRPDLVIGYRGPKEKP